MPTIEGSNLGSALAALRPRQTATCEVCGRQWQALVRPNQIARTCSSACRQALYRRRKRATDPTTAPTTTDALTVPRRS